MTFLQIKHDGQIKVLKCVKINLHNAYEFNGLKTHIISGLEKSSYSENLM